MLLLSFVLHCVLQFYMVCIPVHSALLSHRPTCLQGSSLTLLLLLLPVILCYRSVHRAPTGSCSRPSLLPQPAVQGLGTHPALLSKRWPQVHQRP